MTTTTAKRSFDFKRTDHFLCDPVEDLCIIGGHVLPESERGPLDTAENAEHPLHDPRLREPLSEPFVRNVDTLGILETIVIVKLDDVACVAEGRQRVRAARIVNARRAARGEPPIKVPSIIRRVSSPSELLSIMIAGNEARRDDDIAAKIDKLKRLMARGVSEADAAPIFNVTEGVITSWLRFDDLAIARVHEAVNQGKIALRAGMAIAALKDPAKQEAALDAVTATPTKNGKMVTGRAAREAAKLVTNPNAHVGVADKRTQRALLAAAKATEHPKGMGVTAAAWWQGVEDALTLIVGSDEKPDPRLVELLGRAALALNGAKS